MAWDKGFNFRLTSGFVADGTNETFVLGTDLYPVTRNGVTFGWINTGAISPRDRSAAVDRRLAGVHFSPSGTQSLFRVDLPSAGTYNIRLANGDQGFAQDKQYTEIRDSTTVLHTIDDADGTVVANFNDATGVNRTLAAWPTDNAEKQLTFATTTFILAISRPTAYGINHVVAHLFISQAGPPATNTFTYTPKSSGIATVSWNANPEPDLAGYRVYYGTSSGSYGPAVDVGNVLTTNITGLLPNITYFFVVTAYDTSNNESVFSTEVSAVIWRVLQTGGAGVYSKATTRSFPYQGSGSAVTGGSAGKSRRKVPAVGGGMVAGGAALSQIKGGGKFTYSGIGGAITGGAGDPLKKKVTAGSGSIIMAGAAQSVLARARVVYAYSAAGKADTSGAAAVSKRKSPSVGGTAVISGGGTYSLSSVPRRIFSYTGSGGAATSGNAGKSKLKRATGSGSIVTSGVGAYSHKIGTQTFAYTAAGGMTTFGAAITLKKKVVVGVGAMVMAGDASASLRTGSAPVIRAYIGSGQAVTFGSAGLSVVKDYAVTGGAVAAGGAVSSLQVSQAVKFFYTGNGVAATSGAGAVTTVQDVSGAGGAMMGGSASSVFAPTARVNYSYIASGGMVTTGDALLEVTKHYDGGGIILMGGAASSIQIAGETGNAVYQYAGNGEILMGGDPGELEVIIIREGEGGIIMGGSASYIFIPNGLPCFPFRLFKRDCEVLVKGWSENDYLHLSPFGGKHHEEPSGAEI